MAYRGFMAHVDATHGRAALLEACDDEDLRRYLAQPFLAASWYDLFPIVPATELAARLDGMDVGAFLEHHATRQAETDLSGVYRAILGVISPSLAIHALVRITSRYYGFGDTRVAFLRGKEARVVRGGQPVFASAWYETASTPYIAVVLQRAGAKNVDVRRSRANAREADGVPVHDVVFDLTWS